MERIARPHKKNHRRTKGANRWFFFMGARPKKIFVVCLLDNPHIHAANILGHVADIGIANIEMAQAGELVEKAGKIVDLGVADVEIFEGSKLIEKAGKAFDGRIADVEIAKAF
jgi:hypothetical protein